MNMETKGLGAGSYPEPPAIQESDYPVCEGCGDDYNLKDIDGHILCRSCREGLYVHDYQDRAWEFINATTEDKLNFCFSWWFNQLSKPEKADILMEALKREFSIPFPWNQYQLKSMLRSYTEEYKSDFCDYLDSQGVSSEVVA